MKLMFRLVAVATVWFGNLDYRRLFHPDEGRYAEIPREMVATAGALLFFLSDALIAVDRFVTPFAAARLAIIVTYHLGQLLLVVALRQ